MCGIVGYIGKKDALPIVMEGLRRLEYRGYDSAGVAIMEDNYIEVRRSPGKLDNLFTVIQQNPIPWGRVGLGHTRWATHGVPSERNAHPHMDCLGGLAIVHNGIVENYAQLKTQLRSRGHTFTSETDTEAIIHLIEEQTRDGKSLEEGLRITLRQITGSHAIVVMGREEPDRIVAARLGNAGGLVVGIGDGEAFVASDASAILAYTRRMLFLNDREMAVVTPDGAQCFSIEGTLVEKSVHLVTWDALAASKGDYKHYTQKEIFEQPTTLTNTISARISLDPPDVHLDGLGLSDKDIRSLRRVVLVACGTAWHSCLVGKYMIEGLAGIPAEVDYADEFRYRPLHPGDDTLVVAVTQSGETVDTLEAMAAAKASGARLLSIVNTVGSQASRLAHGVIYNNAGPEMGVASTKAFTSQLAALYLLALYLGDRRGHISKEQLAERLWDLVRLPELVAKTLEVSKQCEELAGRYYKSLDFLYLGRGINYPIALEGALKLKELSYIHAEGYPAGEMKHGPIALIDRDMPVVVIAVQDALYDKVVSNVEQVKTRDGIVIAVATEGDEAIKAKADHVIYVPRTSDYLYPILTVIPLQLLAYTTAVRLGCDVDQPRNLAKSVTVE